jgi:hypothetical protein
MNKTERARGILSQISKNGGPAAAVSFRRYGIKANVTPDNLLNAIILYKRPFIRDLYKNLTVSESRADGDKMEGLGAFEQLIDKTTQVLTGVKDILNTNPAPKPIAMPEETTKKTAINEPNDPDPKPSKKILGLSIPVFTGIVVIIILIVALVLLRKKS